MAVRRIPIILRRSPREEAVTPLPVGDGGGGERRGNKRWKTVGCALRAPFEVNRARKKGKEGGREEGREEGREVEREGGREGGRGGPTNSTDDAAGDDHEFTGRGMLWRKG